MHAQLWPAIVVCGLQISQLLTADAQELPRATNPEKQPTQLQPASHPASIPDMHLNPAYQMFARQIALPAITNLDQTALNIGGKTVFHLGLSTKTITQEEASVAEQLQVPMAMLTTFAHNFLTNATPGNDCATQFRTAVIDYKYLREKWTQYRPPPGNEKLKTTALESLEAGEIDKVWEMFVSLPRPQPPGGLRVQRSD
jgi:hypothetical protein